MIKTSLARAWKPSILLLLIAAFLFSIAASFLPKASAATNSASYTLWYPQNQANSLKDIFNDGEKYAEIGDKMVVAAQGDIFGQAGYKFAFSPDVNRQLNDHDGDNQSDNYYATAKVYCGQGTLSLEPPQQRPYNEIDYTLGFHVNDWDDLTKSESLKMYTGITKITRIGALGTNGQADEGNEVVFQKGADAHYTSFNVTHLDDEGDFGGKGGDAKDHISSACYNGLSRGNYDGKLKNYYHLDPSGKANVDKVVQSGAGASSSSSTSGDGTGVEGDQCETKFSNPLTWAICPISDGITEMVNLLDSAINDLLNIDTNNVFNISSQGSSGFRYHEAWSAFRNIALGLIVIAALIVIIASALGFELLDAYTIRKVLPRILIALLFITLSWAVLEFLVNLTNEVGNGVRALIYAPFSDFHTAQLQNGALAVGTALLGAGIVSLGIIGLLSFGVTALLAALIAFLVLVVRELIVIFLVIIAPIGIAMMILPNTQKAWKFWHSTLTNMLIVFPIIAGMIAIGRVFSVVTYNTQSSEPNFINQIIAFIAYYLPYFLIPFAFRLAGGIIGTLAGIGNDRSRGAFDRLSNFRKGRAADNWQKTKNYSRFSERTPVGRGINTMMGAAANPKSMLRGRPGVAANRHSKQMLLGAEQLKENQIYQANQGDDAFLLAVANRRLAQEKMQQAIIESQDMRDMSEEGERKRNAARANATNYRHALDLASQMGTAGRSRAVRANALSALAATGYQFSPGEQGYEELSSSVRDIVGNDDGAYASLMNETQFKLKGAGRSDLGGINHGALGGPSGIKSGIRKLDSFTRGRGKTDTYHGGAQAWLGQSVVKEDGTTHDSVGAVSAGITTSLSNGQTNLQDIAQWHQMLLSDLPSANDVNKIEIQKQIDAIEGLRVPAPRPGQEGISQREYDNFINELHKNQQRSRARDIDPNLLDNLE